MPACLGEFHTLGVHISSLNLVLMYVPMSLHMGLGLGKPWPLAVWPKFQWDTNGQLWINYKLSIMHLLRVA